MPLKTDWSSTTAILISTISFYCINTLKSICEMHKEIFTQRIAVL